MDAGTYDITILQGTKEITSQQHLRGNRGEGGSLAVVTAEDHPALLRNLPDK